MMQVGALQPYERSLITGQELGLHHGDGGTVTALEIDRWRRPADATDLAVLTYAVAPVLDVGCGPGRIVEALTRSGRAALGVDIAQTAVTMTCARGCRAVRRDIFEPVPNEGYWSTAVLFDGNIGIRGDPAALLARLRCLLMPSGVVLVETSPDDRVNKRAEMRFTRAGEPTGPAFPWAIVGQTALRRYAQTAGLDVVDTWNFRERRFALLSALPVHSNPHIGNPCVTRPDLRQRSIGREWSCHVEQTTDPTDTGSGIDQASIPAGAVSPYGASSLTARTLLKLTDAP